MSGTNDNREIFLLSNNAVQGIGNVKPGLCPHGLAPGACPVCLSSGGGTLRQSDRNRRVGEMTYHECAMIGNMLRARALAQKNHEMNLKHRLLNLQSFENALANMASRLAEFAKLMLGNFVLKPVAVIVTGVVIPLINIINVLPKLFFNPQTLKFEITDKLTALIGEAKAFINKKLSDLMRVVKTSLGRLFKIFGKNNAEDEDTKVDEDKKIFNLREIIRKILRKKKNNDDERNGENN